MRSGFSFLSLMALAACQSPGLPAEGTVGAAPTSGLSGAAASAAQEVSAPVGLRAPNPFAILPRPSESPIQAPNPFAILPRPSDSPIQAPNPFPTRP